MARQPSGRRSTKFLHARLDCELDTDLIDWLDALPPGRRSEVVRDVVRRGLRIDGLRTELEAVITATITNALSGMQLAAEKQGIEFDKNEVEEAFGAQLDNLLGKFG
jgi:hypothetical protein